MTTFIEQATAYAAYHRKPLNRYIQMIGISLIFLSAMILLACIHITIPGILSVNLAAITTLALLGYYARLDWQLALIITPLLGFLCWIASIFSYPIPTAFTLWIFLITLALGALTCFAGYMIEGLRPSLKDCLKQLLIAPLMMAADIIFMTGHRHELKNAIYGQDTLM